MAKQALIIELNNNYTLLKNNNEHFWFQKSCKLGKYSMLQVNDHNNLERICTLFDSCFFSGGAIQEDSFLCLAPTTEAESAKVLPVEAAGKIVWNTCCMLLFPVANSGTLTEDVDLFVAD